MDLFLLLTGLFSLLVLAFLVMILIKGRKTSKAKVSGRGGAAREAAAAAAPAGIPMEVQRVGNRRVARNRPRPAARQAEASDEEGEAFRPRFDDENGFDDGSDGDGMELSTDGKKIGAKKQRKLEMKAERREARERELQEREEKKQRQAELDERRRKEDEKAKEEERLQQEAERLAKEEKERQEHEEYMKLKASFAVEDEGYEQNEEDESGGNKLKQFIDYIKEQKVVLLEDLAGLFQMRTQDVIKRVNDLLEQQLLVGVIDDRGKFIYITKQELETVAKFIRRQGRISIAELVESSNTLIRLQPSNEPIQVNT